MYQYNLRFVISLFLGVLTIALQGQTAWERSVLLSATVQESPAQITLEWPADPNATDYQVYKKTVEDLAWGDPIASLSGSAVAYVDNDVEVGKIYEYAFFKKNFDPVVEIVCVESGSDLQFIVNDMYGIGLCCNFGFGYYEVVGCNSQLAYGDNFGFTDTTFFSICNNGNPCEDLTITLIPDMFPNSTSWLLKEVNTGEILASSGPVGSFISERPKYGFIAAGIKVAPVTQSKGTMLLLVEESLSDTLQEEIEQLKMDLIKDHWKVISESISMTMPVPEVREKIQEYYQTLPDLKALYLLGHIPVPYSGNIYPDTHSENHQGAWSADPYYAEMNGVWTDTVVNITTAFFERNHNVPGDGRFDQDSIPSKVELQIGRVDLSNLPAFSESEIELTRRYLDKAHRYRMGLIETERRALIDDNFLQAFAAPAASGWRNFAPMFGAGNIDELDYFETLRSENYMWSYGCGSGSHISSAGIGTTSDFAQDSLSSIFTMLFGSQFGDWDNVDNFLRAPLASGNTLTNCWAGSPPWTFHHMAMGYPVGYSAFRSMNSTDGVYLNGPQLVHMGLMGDPSQRMFMFPPLAENTLNLEPGANSIQLTWEPSSINDIAGYLVYRASTLDGDFVLISSGINTDPYFEDNTPLDGNNVYQVRVVRLEQSGSGSYYNQSLGVIDSVDYSPIVSVEELIQKNDFHFYPNPGSEKLNYSFTSVSSETRNIQLIDRTGVLQKEWIVPGYSTSGVLFLDNFPAGLYFMVIGKQVQKLIIP